MVEKKKATGLTCCISMVLLCVLIKIVLPDLLYSFQNVEQNVRSTKTKWITDFVIMPQYNKFIVGTG